MKTYFYHSIWGRVIITLLGVLLLIALLIAYLLLRPQKAAAPATPAGQSEPRITWDHGKPVPKASQVRARQAGYYCPSWDTAPGTASPEVCARLDQ